MAAFLTWLPDGAAEVQALYFDVCTEEAVDFTSTATEQPVEDGANVSDHVRRELDHVALEVQVSNQPIYDWNARGGKNDKIPIQLAKYTPPLAPTPGAIFSAVGSAISSLFSGDSEYAANVFQFSSEFNAISDTETKLRKLKDDVQLVTVVTSTSTYENMFLEHIAIERNSAMGDGATFRLELREIRKVAVSIVNAPKPSEIRGAKMKPKGAKGTKDAKAPAQKKSILKGGLVLLSPYLSKWLGGG